MTQVANLYIFEQNNCGNALDLLKKIKSNIQAINKSGLQIKVNISSKKNNKYPRLELSKENIHYGYKEINKFIDAKLNSAAINNLPIMETFNNFNLEEFQNKESRNIPTIEHIGSAEKEINASKKSNNEPEEKPNAIQTKDEDLLMQKFGFN